MLDVDELRNLSQDELLEKLTQFKKTLMQYRFQAKTGKLETKNVLGQARRDIARILTVMNQKKSEEQKQKA